MSSIVTPRQSIAYPRLNEFTHRYAIEGGAYLDLPVQIGRQVKSQPICFDVFIHNPIVAQIHGKRYNTDIQKCRKWAVDMDREWSIYALKDPRTDAVRYVGWAFDPTRRLANHIKDARKSQTYKARWIRQLLALEMQPVCVVMEIGAGDWATAERRWIAHFRAQGAALTNATDGGDGMPGYVWTDAQRERLRRRVFTGEHRLRISNAKRGAPLSEDHKRKVSSSKKGVPLSDAARERLVSLHVGKPLSDEHKAKISEALRGHTVSDETRARQSETRKGRKGRPLSEAAKEKLSRERTGKVGTPWTDEHRQKVVAAIARRNNKISEVGADG